MMNKPRRRRRRKTNSAATVVRTIKKPNSQQPPIMHGWLIPPSQRPGIQFRRTLQAGALSSSSSLHPTPFGMSRKLNYSNVSAVLVYKEEGLLALNRAKQQLKVLPAKTKHLIWGWRKEGKMNELVKRYERIKVFSSSFYDCYITSVSKSCRNLCWSINETNARKEWNCGGVEFRWM